MEITEYIIQEATRAEKLFAAKHKPGFKDKIDFASWFIEALKSQKFSCYYCQTSIFDIKSLIKSGKLKPRKIRHGIRGDILEVDKKSNNQGYKPENCVLSCYYCNNDKSYTLDAEAYKEYFGYNRGRYFKMLLGKI